MDYNEQSLIQLRYATLLDILVSKCREHVGSHGTYKNRLQLKVYRWEYNYLYYFNCIKLIFRRYDENRKTSLEQLFISECTKACWPLVLTSWLLIDITPDSDHFAIYGTLKGFFKHNTYHPILDVDLSLLSKSVYLTHPLAILEACGFATGLLFDLESNVNKYTYLPKFDSIDCHNLTIKTIQELRTQNNIKFSIEELYSEINFLPSIFD